MPDICNPLRLGCYEYWPAIQRANALVEEFCASDARLHFVDAGASLCDGRGRARRELFRWDGIHLSPAGYAAWSPGVKHALEEVLGTP